MAKKKHQPMFHPWAKWAYAKQFELDRPLTLADCRREDGCPVSQQTIKSYLTDEKWDMMRGRYDVFVEREGFKQVFGMFEASDEEWDARERAYAEYLAYLSAKYEDS